VDDNEDAAELLSYALSSSGYATRVAHDGATALRAADEFRPDVAVLDIGLPVMDGYTLAKRLKESAAHAGLRVVALSGYGQDEDVRRARSAGFDEYLVKPVDLDRLLVTVERLTTDPVAAPGGVRRSA
jgi:DNA-binding response OmpR family regulator